MPPKAIRGGQQSETRSGPPRQLSDKFYAWLLRLSTAASLRIVVPPSVSSATQPRAPSAVVLDYGGLGRPGRHLLVRYRSDDRKATCALGRKPAPTRGFVEPERRVELLTTHYEPDRGTAALRPLNSGNVPLPGDPGPSH